MRFKIRFKMQKHLLHRNLISKGVVSTPLKISGRTTPGHIYAHSICPQLAAVVAAPCHLNNIATNIRSRAKTLLTVGEIYEQLMHIASPMLTVFSALVSMAPPFCACRHLEKDILTALYPYHLLVSARVVPGSWPVKSLRVAA
jgi:hypothetical protein